MQVEPGKEHLWLSKLVGDWTFTSSCHMGPDQSAIESRGTESVRSLGGLWTIGEGTGGMPDGGEMKSIMTLGFDPAKGRFVGSFIASCMTYFWRYDGALDVDADRLVLDADGPSFSGEGTAKYQDIVTFLDDDTRTLTSQVLGEDGSWTQFMEARYTRKR